MEIRERRPPRNLRALGEVRALRNLRERRALRNCTAQ